MTSLADHIRENRVFLSLLKMLKRHGCKFLLAEVAGPGGWDEIRKGCVRLPAFGREVWTLDLPSLIRAKRAAGRPKDLLVLPELESLLDAAADSGPAGE